MERTLEELEKQSWDKINVALKNNEAQEEQDDSVICDVCRSVNFSKTIFFFTSLF
jgi:hypothetical protein